MLKARTGVPSAAATLTTVARLAAVAALAAVATLAPHGLLAQATPLQRGSDSIEVLGHLPLGPALSVSDIDVEQDLARPYAYVGRMQYGDAGPRGLDIISIEDPERPELLYQWRIEDQELHTGTGGMDVKHFKVNGRHYVVQSLQFGGGGPDRDLGAVVLDVEGLPDPSSVREVARIREPDLPGGFHNIFVYKHSDGRVLLFATVSGPYANAYDLGKIVEGASPEEALAGRIPNPQVSATSPGSGYHDFYVGYHPDTDEDRFYGGGTGGYYVYDITSLEAPELRVSLTGISGVSRGHTFTPSSDGRYVVAESEYEFAPLRIFVGSPDREPPLAASMSRLLRLPSA